MADASCRKVGLSFIRAGISVPQNTCESREFFQLQCEGDDL